MSGQHNADLELIQDIAGFTHDPYGHALYCYEWGKGELAGKDGPRKWQREVMEDIAAHLQNPETRFTPYRLAIASGHGIGKSALVSMLVKWGMDTCDDCKVVVTANTAPQLATKTWPEISKWFRLGINQWYDVNATSIVSAESGHEKSWRADAITWSAHNTEAFAGLHNEGKRIILVMDEASAIDDRVWEVAEGALTDANTEILWLVFGNPTRASGRFRECFRQYKHRWETRQIDSRDVEGINKDQIKQWVDDHGEDSDFVKVRVRGMFPTISAKQFISTDTVDAAFGKALAEHQYNFAPVILTCDPAWEGDDLLVIGKRQGLAFWILRTIPKNDNDIQIANILGQLEDEHKADAVFIDGGYGTGIVSAGRTMNRNWTLVWFGEKSGRPGYLNKRAEMWGLAKEWLQQGGAIPKDQELYQELTSVETVPRADGVIQLESKKDMKARGLPSPNKADTLVLSFAHPVAKKTAFNRPDTQQRASYDPLKSI